MKIETRLLIILSLFLMLPVLKAQVLIENGQIITQDFDMLGTDAVATLPTGWRVDKDDGNVRTVGTYAGAATQTERRAGNNMPSNAANGIYNFGAGDMATATDRGIGWISSGSATKSGNLYVALENSGTEVISYLTISYDVEKYRQGIRAEGFSIQMYYSLDGNSWTDAGTEFLTSFPGSDTANAGYPSAPGEVVHVTNKRLPVEINPGSKLYLAWNYSVTSGTFTSNAQALGVDNVEIMAPQSGIAESFIITNDGIANQYDTAIDFEGKDFGNIPSNALFLLKGGIVNTWENPSDAILSAEMIYRVYEQSATPPDFDTLALPWTLDLINPGDKEWRNDTMNINILDGLSNGTYIIEVFFNATYNSNGIQSIHTDNNSGANYAALFTVTDPVYNSGILESVLIYNTGNDITAEVNTFDNSSLGVFFDTGTFVLKGGELTTWKNQPPDSVTSARMMFRVYEQNATPAAFDTIVLPWYDDFPAPSQDQIWKNDTMLIDLLDGLTSGIYYLEVYFEADYISYGAPHTHTDDNNGSNYSAAFEFLELKDNDMAVVEWVAPKSGCNLTSTESIVIKVANVGALPQTNVPVAASIDGGQTAIGPEFIIGTINPGDTVTYTFTATADLSVPGAYHCGAAVLLPTDENNFNDTISEYVYSFLQISSYPYDEDFDTNGGWAPFTISGSQQWELGTPAQTQLNSAYSGYNQNAWMTKLSENYNNNTDVYLISPCFDFTGLSMPRISLWLNIKTEENYDAMVMESSTDGGANWTQVVGDAGFYNNNSHLGPVFPPKWSGSNNGWTNYQTSLPTLAGESDVRLRFRFTTNTQNTDEGIAIDAINIYEQNATDVALYSIAHPDDLPCGISNDSIVITIKNEGYITQDTIPFIVEITKPDSSTTTINDTVFSSVPFNATTSKTVYFNTQQPGQYTITAYTLLTGDVDNHNDTAYASFMVAYPMPLPYVQDFENGLQEWQTDMAIVSGHGASSQVLSQHMNATNDYAYAQSPKIGAITSNTILLFDYRYIEYAVSAPWTGATLSPGDSMFVYVTKDCGSTFEIIDTIHAGNHSPSATKTTLQYDMSAFAGENIQIRFDIHGASTANYFVDLDNIILAELPVVDLGPDEVICANTVASFDAQNASPYSTYQWFTTASGAVIATTQILTTDSAATYYVIVDNGFGFTATDSVTLSTLPYPTINLGDDLLICDTDSVTLDAGMEVTTFFEEGLRGTLPLGWTSYNGGGEDIEQPAAGGYLLLDREDDWVVSETFDMTGLPNVEVYVDIASYGSGSFNSVAHNLMIIEISNNNGATWNADFPMVTDTTTGITYETQGPFPLNISGSEIKFRFRRPASVGRGVRFRDFKITTSEPFVSYLWSTGETTQTIDVSTADTYWAEVTAANGCKTTDTINIQFFNVADISFGGDTAICDGDILILDAGSSFIDYQWQDNSTGQTFTVDAPGTYWVVATDTNGCVNTDTINVDVNPLPYVNLGADTAICKNTTLTLDAGAGINYTYIWRHVGQTTVIGTSQTLDVDTAGHYYVIVDNGCALIASDTIDISLLPLPNVNIGADTSICNMTSITLDAGAIHETYLWSTSDTTQQITVSAASSYSVTVTNIHGCSNADTITVDVLPLPQLNLGNDTLICIYDNILLDAGAGFTSYLWFDNSQAQTLLIEGSTHGVGTVNAYVTVTDNNNCHNSDSIQIIIDACTGLKEILDAFVIYPNPTNGMLFLKTQKAITGDTHIKLNNILGQLVYDKVIKDAATGTYVIIDMQEFAKGTYILSFVNENGSVAIKILYQ